MSKYISLILSVLLLLSPSMAMGRKVVGYKLPGKETSKEKSEKVKGGTFKVELKGENAENKSPYSREDIEFSGFDKKINSSAESFFITNKTQRTMTAIDLTIDYLTPDGRQLHQKSYSIKCNIPPGETRRADIKSWDTQHSFYYVKNAPIRAEGTPFIVKFHPTAFYLKY